MLLSCQDASLILHKPSIGDSPSPANVVGRSLQYSVASRLTRCHFAVIPGKEDFVEVRIDSLAANSTALFVLENHVKYSIYLGPGDLGSWETF